jgi:molecular chaperone GrpE
MNEAHYGPSAGRNGPRVRVSDKRRGRHGSEPASDDGVVSADGVLSADDVSDPASIDEGIAGDATDGGAAAQGAGEKAHDYLEDLKRLQADFDNYRKRMLKEQTQIAERAGGRLIERLLPVLDNLERALAHGDDGGGLNLIYKELLNVLRGEGLELIPAAGAAFDPHLHEAVDAREDESVREPTVVGVYRPGYRLRERVLRPAMVVVARPVEGRAQESPDAEPARPGDGGDSNETENGS